MLGRQELFQKVHALNIQIIKEWMKQAYYRKTHETQESKVEKELKTIESILHEYISLQDTLLSESLIITENQNKGTPKFISENFVLEFEEHDGPLGGCFRTLSSIKKTLGQAMKIEGAIVEQYKVYIEKLKSRYENESLSIPAVTSKKNVCPTCKELGQELDALTSEIEKQKRIFQQQLQKAQKDAATYKNMYTELKITQEEFLAEFKMKNPNDEDLDFGKVKKSILNMSTEKEKLQYECKEMKKNTIDLEESCAEFMKKLEDEQNKSLKLQKTYKGLMEETQSQQLKLDKAQNFIKKLNEECEKLAKQLRKTEDEVDYYKKIAKSNERFVVDVKKKLPDIEVVKKTEERLREEVYMLKNKIIEITSGKDTEIDYLKGIIEELIYDKSSLEKELEDLEEKLNEIDEMNRDRAELYGEICKKNKEYEGVIGVKNKEIEKVCNEAKAQEECKEREMVNLKIQVENLIRHIQNSENSSKFLNSKPRAPLSESTNLQKNISYGNENYKQPKEIATKMNFLICELQEALKREADLKSQVNSLITAEGKRIKESLEHNKKMELDMRREIERWIMRNEELEQRIISLSQNCAKMLKTLQDYQKLIHIKEVQYQDMRSVFDSEKKSLENTIAMLKDEYKSLATLMTHDIFPSSRLAIDRSLDMAHKKIKLCRSEAERFKIEKEFNKKIFEQDKESQLLIERLYTENNALKQDLHHLKQTLLIKEQDFESNHQKYSEQNIYLKELAIKESEEKEIVKGRLEEEMEFFKAQIEYLKGILTNTEKDKYQLENEHIELQKKIESLLNDYKKVCSEKQIMQSCYEELNEKVRANANAAEMWDANTAGHVRRVSFKNYNN